MKFVAAICERRESPIGSVNFVLLRHDLSVGPASARFYSLYMHLHDELKEAQGNPAWMTKPAWQQAMKEGKKGQVVTLDEPIEAGEVIGRMGKAGPTVDGDDLLKTQVHLEIFSEDEPFAAMDPRWQVHAVAAGLAFLFYLLLGAIGAAWSRHVGGSPGERLAAGVFPLVLHAAVVGLYALSRGVRGLHLDGPAAMRLEHPARAVRDAQRVSRIWRFQIRAFGVVDAVADERDSHARAHEEPLRVPRTYLREGQDERRADGVLFFDP
jgi:hypothetical protein